MPTNVEPYIHRDPGDLITAEDWNEVQVDVKKDITDQVQSAIGNLKTVMHAGDADTLGGKTPEQLTQDIITKTLQMIPRQAGYLRTFNRLNVGEEKIITHGLKAFPLTDVYQLEYFQAVCSHGDRPDEEEKHWVNFYLYHTSERKVRGVTIEDVNKKPYKVLFEDMLAQYHVTYTDTTSLDELETHFWAAFFKSPNDEFDPDQYCHSPWFEKCCGERRSVKALKDAGDWDDIWLKMVPRKTINWPTLPATVTAATPSVAPTQIQVAHHDFDNVGLLLMANPVYPLTFPGTPRADGTLEFTPPTGYEKELKVMVLMKV